MQSSLIGKIEKAKRYAEEKGRLNFFSFTLKFRGDNEDHTLTLKEGKLKCNCSFFPPWGWCSHTMALQKILGEMLPLEAREEPLKAE